MGGALGLFGLVIAFRKKISRFIIGWWKKKGWPMRLGSSRGIPSQPEELTPMEAEKEGLCEKCHGPAKRLVGEAMARAGHSHTV
jgi:hypothetical protein